MPDWKEYVRRQLGDLGMRPEHEVDFVEELAQHLESRYSESISQGASPEQAFESATRDLGDSDVLRRAARATKRLSAADHVLLSDPPRVANARLQRGLDNLWQDLRFVLRSLSKSPAYALVAIGSLALGIGANSAVFSILNQVMFKPLPFPHGDRIVHVREQHPSNGNRWRFLQNGKMYTLREQSQTLEAVSQSLAWGGAVTLTSDGASERAAQQLVDMDIFSTFEVQPLLGRSFEASDIGPDGRSGTVVISYGLWQRRFGGTPDAIGRRFEVEGVRKTIIGVMPEGFWLTRGPDRVDFWRAFDARGMPHARAFAKFARLRDGFSLQQAQQEAETIAAEWDRTLGEDPSNRWPIRVEPLRATLFGGVTGSLWMLQLAVAFVLLIACVNVANMMLARGTARRKELTLRVALGAGRWQLARLLLTESVVLGLLGGAGGIAIALGGIRIFRALAPGGFPMLHAMEIDFGVLAFMSGISLLSGLLFGLFPVVQGWRLDLNAALKGGTRDGRSLGARSRRTLLVSELALAAALLGCAGLVTNGLLNEVKADWGFRTDDILSTYLTLDGSKYWSKDPDMTQRVRPAVALYWTNLLERLRAIPGVEGVGLGRLPSVPGGRYPFSIVGREGSEPVTADMASRPRVPTSGVDPGFFTILEIPLLEGRYIEDEDAASSPWTAVVDRTFAQRHFPNGDAIGQRLSITRYSPGDNAGFDDKPREIVGIVEDVRDPYWVTERLGRVYFPHLQLPTEFKGNQYAAATTNNIMVKTSATAAVADQVRAAVEELDPLQVVAPVEPLESVIANGLSFTRMYANLLGVFGAIAILLAMVGTYGVISFSVNQRRAEFGVRMALGAQRGHILRSVLADAIFSASVGLALGLAIAFGVRGVLESVADLTASSPETLAAIALILGLTAVASALVPARRAAGVEPMKMLRHD